LRCALRFPLPSRGYSCLPLPVATSLRSLLPAGQPVSLRSAGIAYLGSD